MAGSFLKSFENSRMPQRSEWAVNAAAAACENLAAAAAMAPSAARHSGKTRKCGERRKTAFQPLRQGRPALDQERQQTQQKKRGLETKGPELQPALAILEDGRRVSRFDSFNLNLSG
ncbi:hypothetical protein K3722_08070 [Leisingera caerulea]|uniref:Uncharacterized protein n=1 Tax=Leisingera caerulea TaxID=506591 RepID=A0ABY5X0Z7_LEICA|nr:hypothetical protein [Leisingera caerulea]UWQ60078.1 hypothetical protein K3722_08070 [Leisingera caerulea]